MAHIKEPKGVDFIIQSEPLTDNEKEAISKYIANYKLKSNATIPRPKNNLKIRKQLV